MVIVRAEGWRHKDLSLLTPKIEDPDLRMVDAVVQFKEGNCAAVIVENCSLSPMQLKKGLTLGELESVDPVEESGEGGSVSAVLPASESAKPASESSVDRRKKLMEQLDFNQDHLSSHSPALMIPLPCCPDRSTLPPWTLPLATGKLPWTPRRERRLRSSPTLACMSFRRCHSD